MAPRVVKVKITVKEEKENKKKEQVRNIQPEVLEQKANKAEDFLKQFIRQLNVVDIDYSIKKENDTVFIDITGSDSEFLIGYRGEALNALQTIISSVVNNKEEERVRIILNIQNYREKRKKDLEILADKLAKTVSKTGKTIKLEPMTAYERKIIHSRMQDYKNIKTNSVGEEPYRRVVISKIKNKMEII